MNIPSLGGGHELLESCLFGESARRSEEGPEACVEAKRMCISSLYEVEGGAPTE